MTDSESTPVLSDQTIAAVEAQVEPHPRLAVATLAASLLTEIAERDAVFAEHKDTHVAQNNPGSMSNEARRETIDQAFDGEGEAYKIIQESVSRFDTDTQLALIEGHVDWYDQHGFEGDPRNPRTLVTTTAVHAVRDVVWDMYCNRYDAYYDDTTDWEPSDAIADLIIGQSE